MVEGGCENHVVFGGHLGVAGRSMLADARRALDDPALSDAERVHELRKAFKRWRAFLRLLAKPIGAPAAALRRDGGALMRRVSPARDAQAALDAIDDLAGGSALSPRILTTIRARLTALRDAAESASLTSQLHAEIDRYLARADDILATWPLAGIGFDAVADGFAATYRRARRLTPDNWRDADPAHLHALRRRVIEHRHQMELIAPLWPRATKARSQDAQRLRHRLGACQDLSVLAGFVAPRQPLAAWRARLMPLIAARRERHVKNAARLAGRLFEDKPHAFRRRIAALSTESEARMNKAKL
ncbi:MAG TPA: CHAD domain-containing protein [Pseudolabrys sp.]|nr:CHAD domain-containing protein [Pseudolabrys sp.]